MLWSIAFWISVLVSIMCTEKEELAKYLCCRCWERCLLSFHLNMLTGVPGLGLLLFQSFSTLFNKHLLSGHEQFLGVLLSHSSRRPLHVSNNVESL